MSHVLKFCAVFLLVTVFLFAFFCLDVSFDESFALSHSACATHGRLRVYVTLPYGVADTGAALDALATALPSQFVNHALHLGDDLAGLFSLLQESLLREAEGCTAFSP